jgi:hypothetical protein
MNGSSSEGYTEAFLFDAVIILLVFLGPFLLPWIARFGGGFRILAMVIAVSLGMFLFALIVLPFQNILDVKRHSLLAGMMELGSLLLVGIVPLLLLIVPVFLVGLGINALLGKKREYDISHRWTFVHYFLRFYTLANLNENSHLRVRENRYEMYS